MISAAQPASQSNINLRYRLVSVGIEQHFDSDTAMRILSKQTLEAIKKQKNEQKIKQTKKTLISTIQSLFNKKQRSIYIIR